MNIYGLCSLVTRERAKEMNDWYLSELYLNDLDDCEAVAAPACAAYRTVKHCDEPLEHVLV